MNLVYLKLKEEYVNQCSCKYLVYNAKKEEYVNNILFMDKPYEDRNIEESWWDIISEEEFKLENL